MKNQLVVILLAVGFINGPVLNAAIVSKPTVTFVAVGKPAMLKIKGQSDELTSNVTLIDGSLNAQLDLPLKTLTTGLSLRDEHMKEKYLQIAQYPNATLVIQKLILPATLELLSQKSESQSFTGDLSLHGITRKVTGTYSLIKMSAGHYRVKAEYEINLSNFNIEIPTYVGIKVADKVGVQSEFDFAE